MARFFLLGMSVVGPLEKHLLDGVVIDNPMCEQL